MNWKKYKLEELAKRVTVGFVGSMAQEYVPAGVPLLRSQNIKPFTLDFNNLKFISQKFHKKIIKSSLKKDDVAIIRTGNPGTACVIPDGVSELNCSDLVIVTPDKNKIDPHFLCFYFNSIANGYVNAQLVGAVQQHFNVGSAKKMEIILPPINEQAEIVHIIKNVQDKIELNLQMNKTLEDMAMALYKHWFVDFGPFREGEMVDSELGEIPKGWEVKRLGEVFEIKIGRTPPRKEPEWFSSNSGIKWVSIKDMGNAGTYIFNTSEFLTEDAVRSKNVPLVLENTAILSFKLTVGRVSITTEEMVTNEAIAQFVRNKKTTLSSEYLYLALKVFNYDSLGSTSSIATAVNSNTVKSMEIIVPDEKVVKAFQQKVIALFEMIKNNSHENQTLSTLRDTLLPKLISGEVRVKGVEKMLTQVL